jgi:transcription-repair coupling factor (superfamily II helicase)
VCGRFTDWIGTLSKPAHSRQQSGAAAHRPGEDAAPGREIIAGVPDGLTALLLAQLTEAASAGAAGTILHVARDDRRLEALAEGLAFFAPKLRVIKMPAWDTVPYDRIGPNAEIVAMRMAALARLSAAAHKGSTVLLTTVNAILQRLPPRDFIRRSLKNIAPGQRLDMKELIERLALAGYQRTGTVMEPGEYAVRGGILDLYPPGRSSPVRLDFFGDTLEHIKAFDPETQRTGKIVQRLTLMPVSEVAFGPAAEKLFRRGYVALFGPATSQDQLYEAVSAGQRYPGLEHWLPLFHDRLETLFDYAPGASVSFDHLAEEAVTERLALIEDHYKARLEGLEALKFGAPPYKPVPPQRLFFTAQEWREALGGRLVRQLSPFEEAERPGVGRVRSLGGRAGGGGGGVGAGGGGGGATQLCRRALGRKPQPVRRCRQPPRGPAASGQTRDPRRLHGWRPRAAGRAARRPPARQCTQGRQLRGGRGPAARADRARRAADRARL